MCWVVSRTALYQWVDHMTQPRHLISSHGFPDRLFACACVCARVLVYVCAYVCAGQTHSNANRPGWYAARSFVPCPRAYTSHWRIRSGRIRAKSKKEWWSDQKCSDLDEGKAVTNSLAFEDAHQEKAEPNSPNPNRRWETTRHWEY